MGRFFDFWISLPEFDQNILGEKIITSLVCHRLDKNKPVIFFIGGDSGEGKSYTAIKILDIVNKYYGVETKETLNDQLVYVPIEYANKMNNLLFSQDKTVKKMKAIIIDEGRELIPAKQWYNFINQVIADVNAMSRGVKPLALLVVSQFIKDIDFSVRRTITYYAECYRPLTRPLVSFSPWFVWKDTRDIENPKLRKRHIRGYLKIGNKRPFLYVVKRLWVKKPREELTKIYNKTMVETKAMIIRRKLEDVLREIEKSISPRYEKIDYLVNYYLERPDILKIFMERKGDKIHIRKEFEKAHDITPSERKEFEKRLLEKLVERGMIDTGLVS